MEDKGRKIKEVTIKRSRTIRHAQYIMSQVEAGFVVEVEDEAKLDAIVREMSDDIDTLLEREELKERKHFRETVMKRSLKGGSE